MVTESKKKRLVTSFHNLSPEQQNEVKTLYPQGFADVMMRIDKPDGTFFYVVPFETADTYYLVKIDVKIDDATEETDDGGGEPGPGEKAPGVEPGRGRWQRRRFLTEILYTVRYRDSQTRLSDFFVPLSIPT